MVKVMLILLNFYQKSISPIKGPTCRFYPTCSEYSKQAFLKYGFIKGFMLTVKRVSRCHPFNEGGYDPLQ
ncbi:membrane protein insertion efficiency factor YidD [Alkalicella caledoniensis]|uniref:Putative membrane protein insertion efficiency factor n=1 Tax=Alkalicella caledoniensis TaxID=2731377 RepID=A0A7G9W8J0_ALKCA|nr:membrane protein insertion efficiency factor YidD [Alkalicella caledoniensis]QNO15002.1 membrane protein insertion efficiency factor YidD [Alkalicella caledoniensis]